MGPRARWRRRLAPRRRHGERAHATSLPRTARHGLDISDETTGPGGHNVQDPATRTNWVHCLCDSDTWAVKEPGSPSALLPRLFDDVLSPSGSASPSTSSSASTRTARLTTSTAISSGDYGAADELIAAYPNKFNCAVRCDGLNPYDIPDELSQGQGRALPRARDTVLAAVDMLTDEADEAGIDACPEFYRNDYISMYLKTQGLGERVKVGGRRGLALLGRLDRLLRRRRREGRDFETLGEAMRAAKRLVDVEGYEGAAVYDRKQEAWCGM